MNNEQKYFINDYKFLRTILFVLFESMSFLKYGPNEKSKQTNKVETIFSFVWFFCLFRILQKIKHDSREQLHVYFPANTTDDITFYTIFTDPMGTTTSNSPWNVADTTIPDPSDPSKTIPQDDKIQPWVQVLNYACVRAKGKSSKDDAVEEITKQAYTDFGQTKIYNGYQTHTVGTTCNLTGILAGTVVDCRDMSAVVQLFSQIVGVSDIQVRVIEGYSTGQGFNYKPIKAIGSTTSWASGNWNFHQVVWYGGNIYSACELLNQTSPKQAVGMSLSEYKSLLYDSGTWNLVTPFVITTFY
jgi:hypothetical protein